MPLLHKEKGDSNSNSQDLRFSKRNIFGNGNPSDLDSGITAFNLFNAKLLEGFALRTNIGWRDTYLADGGHNAVFNFAGNGTHSGGGLRTQLQQMEPDRHRVLSAAPRGA
jgi:diacylglycerol O-acyltransferase/trehalose O-mycolyltransferase